MSFPIIRKVCTATLAMYDVCSDQLMLRSSLLCFVEAFIYSNEAYDIHGFTPVVRLGCPSEASGARPQRGILVFIRNELFENVSLCSSGSFFDSSTNLASPVFEFASFEYRPLGIMVVYKSTTYPLTKFETEFKDLFKRHTFLNSNCLVLGDYILCLHSTSGCSWSIFDFLAAAKCFSSLLDLYTYKTNCNLHIDWAFSNIFDNRYYGTYKKNVWGTWSFQTSSKFDNSSRLVGPNILFWFKKPRCKSTASLWCFLGTDFNVIIGS